MLFQSISTHMCINTERPKPVVKVTPDQRVFRGETVTLTCDIQRGNIQWTYSWFKDGSVIRRVTERVYTITSVSDNSGEYSCRGERSDSQRSDTSAAVTLTVSGESTLTVTPDSPVFTGETVNLKCVIESDNNWRYEWYKGSYRVMSQTSERYTVNRDTLTIRGATTSDQDQYWCRGQRNERPKSSHSSSAVYLTVMDPKPKPELMPDAAGAALTGNTVTLTCHMDLSPGWDFYWYEHTLNSETKKTKTNYYRVKIDSVSDGGQYWCRAGRGKPVYYTQYSDALWVNVTGERKHKELEALTLSVLLLYSTQEFIRAEQREDDRPITQRTVTHSHCGSLVSQIMSTSLF
uniref:Ig-like domain-containing protein n=1 Tax=Sinocyclocheilus anshuiensis TaxID=1608454 RepID=A0A671PVM9_9TELE